jgi:DNA-binding CsgD family transcriptional regulator
VSGHDQQDASVAAGAATGARGIAAVVPAALAAEVSAALDGLGLDCQRVSTVAELDGVSPALAVVFVEGKIAAELPLLGGLLAGTPVVIVSAEVRPGEIRGALAAGVAGVVLADRLDSQLRPCLEAVRTGQVCVPRAQAPQVEPARLSPREKQILGLVVMGYMNGEIGEQLFVAESTVKSHLSSAFGKLGVGSRSEAVELILDPERGLGTGILALGGEPLEAAPAQ